MARTCTHATKDGSTALHLASVSPDWDVSSAAVVALVGAGADVNGRDNLGKTPLHVAIRRVPELIEAGADCNLLDSLGRTPLHYVRPHRRFDGALGYLLEAGCDPNVRDIDGNSPLHFAAEYGNPFVISRLLRFGAKPEIRNKEGETPSDVLRPTGPWWNSAYEQLRRFFPRW